MQAHQPQELDVTKPRLSVGAATTVGLVFLRTGPFGLGGLCHGRRRGARGGGRLPVGGAGGRLKGLETPLGGEIECWAGPGC